MAQQLLAVEARGTRSQAMTAMRTTALLYHDIVPRLRYEASGFQGADADIYKLDCDEFRRHMRRIAAGSGPRPQIITDTDGSEGERRLLLTFDDGGVSAIEHAAGILAEFNWPGHFFVTTGRIGTAGFLDEQQVRVLRRAGHAIGSHSSTHPLRMAALSAAQLDREWSESVARLEDILGEPVAMASIPGGYYSRAVASAAAQAGVRLLFTSEPVTRTATVDGCLVVGRFSVQQGVSEDWVAAVVADHLLPRAGRYVAWNGKKLLKAAGGTAWLAARKAILARRAGR
ncbi:MAG TPA: polysaccharide deacetylase family protein [Bryobacteraceae bacterium]|nr:polysaccharide deacetylase family protein [Bryobacteraceae bacterium]